MLVQSMLGIVTSPLSEIELPNYFLMLINMYANLQLVFRITLDFGNYLPSWVEAE